MQNLRILVRLVEDGVEAIFYVATVDIAVSELDRVCIFSPGHEPLSKISVVYGNGKEICSVDGRVYKIFLWAKLKKSGVISFVCGNSHPIIFTPRKYGSSDELPRPDTASEVPVKNSSSSAQQAYYRIGSAQPPIMEPLYTV